MPVWAAANYVVRRIADDGATEWTEGANANCYGLAVDAAERALMVHARYNSVTHVRRSGDGTSQWTGDHGADLYAAAYDPQGNIYIAGDTDGDGHHYRKLTAAGTEVYSIAGNGICRAISTRGTEAMYVSIGNSLLRRDPDSTSWVADWSYNHGAQINAIVEDSAGYLYLGGVRSSDVSVRKIDPDGDLVWDFDTGGDVNGLAIDDAGAVLYAVGARVGTATAWKLDLDGDEITTGWPVDHGNTLNAATVDADGNVYVGGVASSGTTLRKYQADGTPVSWPDSQLTGPVYALVYVALLHTEPPGLSLPIALGAPIWAYTHSPAGLLLPVGLGLPGLSAPPTPPAPDPALRTVYRLYLSDPGGGSDLLELPLAALECRRRVNESTWLALSVPAVTDARLAAIAARLQGQVVIYAGVATPSGETLGEFLRATLTEVAIARDGNASGATLTARVIPTAFAAGSYSLQGVRERGADGGRRTVTCAVDPRIRPNDTVNDGASSWTAGIITYRIDPITAAMRITEAL
jgi:hypothetical protein